MTFYTYMVRKHIKEDSPMGDLAKDMREDRDRFPRNSTVKLSGWHDSILSYLYDCGACSGCIDAFEEAWKEYAKWLKSKSSKVLSQQ